MKQFTLGILLGAGLAALFYPIFFKKELEENRLLTENANIERLNKFAIRIENKIKSNGSAKRTTRKTNTANA